MDRLIGKSVLGNTFSAVIVTAFFIILGKWFLILFGKEFVAAWNILIILSLGALFQTAIGPTSLLLNMTGYERYAAAAGGVTVVINILLVFVFIPMWGTEGVAMAELFSFVAYKSISAVIVRRKIGITPWITLRRRTPLGNS